MPRFKLIIEYAGTRFSGWQIQKNARTVQGEIDRAVRQVTGRRDFELYGSGRTDAGVHALAQVAHLDVSTNLPPDLLVGRVNDELPADINILGATVVSHRFHARHDAVARRYLYQIARRRTALAKAYVWWVREPLDVGGIRQAARALIGLRDFKPFVAGTAADRARESGERSEGGRNTSTLALLERLDVIEQGDLVLVVAEGSHFLWKMVRRIVGVLVEVGRGALSTAATAQLIGGTSDVLSARLTAPPSGLFLSRVYYKGDKREEIVRAATPLD